MPYYEPERVVVHEYVPIEYYPYAYPLYYYPYPAGLLIWHRLLLRRHDRVRDRLARATISTSNRALTSATPTTAATTMRPSTRVARSRQREPRRRAAAARMTGGRSGTAMRSIAAASRRAYEGRYRGEIRESERQPACYDTRRYTGTAEIRRPTETARAADRDSHREGRSTTAARGGSAAAGSHGGSAAAGSHRCGFPRKSVRREPSETERRSPRPRTRAARRLGHSAVRCADATLSAHPLRAHVLRAGLSDRPCGALASDEQLRPRAQDGGPQRRRR